MPTFNEMFYNTLRTKTNKEPKYRAELEKLGFTIIPSTWSAQGYWGIAYNNSEYVISKDYNNNTRLYDGAVPIGNRTVKIIGLSAIKKIDFGHMVEVREWRKRFSPVVPIDASNYQYYGPAKQFSGRVRKYYDYKERIKMKKDYKSYLLTEAKELSEKVKKLQEQLDYNKKQYDKTSEDLIKLTWELHDLKNN